MTRAAAWLVLCVPCYLAADTAEERALAWLEREVPAWFAENGCYSCHNNGDGARALYVARRLGRELAGEALRNTSAWLASPPGWDENRGDPRFSDKKLARLQFAAALAEGVAAGMIGDRAALAEAAEMLAADQRPDGSWQVDDETAAGSPVTWGSALATVMARGVLERAGAGRFHGPLERAEKWLLDTPPRSVPDAAAMLWGLSGGQGSRAAEKRRECIEMVRGTQTSDGGWGPARHAPAEPFDTALVLLALARTTGEADALRLIAGGRAWLLHNQLPSGGWPETTRPPGGQSYAQHVSTTAWAALALLETAK